MFLIWGLRSATSVCISIFQVDLAGNEKLIELRYEMDIINFNLLFILNIYSRTMKFGIVVGDKKYLKFFWSLIIQSLLEKSQV